MSVVPMMVVEAANAISPVEYAEAYSLSPINTSVFAEQFQKRLRAPWVLSRFFAKLPKQWVQRNIGTIVSHQLRCGMNYLWLEAIYYGMALVHNSRYLPTGCGYYYDGENITAGALALQRAIKTHNTSASNNQRCLQPYSTSNPENIARFEHILDLTIRK